MSRKVKVPILIPKEVKVQVGEKEIELRGPKGEVRYLLPDGIKVEEKDGHLFVHADGISKPFHGLYRAIIANYIKGVAHGFEKRLLLVGVGFRAAVKKDKLELQIGFSYPLEVEIPEGIEVSVEKNVQIVVSGIDKQKVGEFAAKIREMKKPEPYKGKGIRYLEEQIRKKAGKAAKGA